MKKVVGGWIWLCWLCINALDPDEEEKKGDIPEISLDEIVLC